MSKYCHQYYVFTRKQLFAPKIESAAKRIWAPSSSTNTRRYALLTKRQQNLYTTSTLTFPLLPPPECNYFMVDPYNHNQNVLPYSSKIYNQKYSSILEGDLPYKFRGKRLQKDREIHLRAHWSSRLSALFSFGFTRAITRKNQRKRSKFKFERLSNLTGQ